MAKAMKSNKVSAAALASRKTGGVSLAQAWQPAAGGSEAAAAKKQRRKQRQIGKKAKALINAGESSWPAAVAPALATAALAISANKRQRWRSESDQLARLAGSVAAAA